MAEKTNEELENEFYAKDFFFSYSGLNKLLYSPQLFYNWYILNQKEDRTDAHLVEGKAIHCLLLEKEMFDKQFAIMPGKIPAGNNKTIVDAMYKMWLDDHMDGKSNNALRLVNYSDEILQLLVDINLHQSLTDDKDLTKSGAKTGNEKRLEKVLTIDNTTYFEFLQKSSDKNIIDEASLARCEEAVEAVKANAGINSLLCLGGSDFEMLTVKNEMMLQGNLKDYPFGLRGILDNFVIDHESKLVYINDLKTSGKSLTDFPESVGYWNYWMQAAIYLRLVMGYLMKDLQVTDLSGWTYEFRFIVIDKYNQVYPFLVTNETMSEWQTKLDEVLEEAKYHYTNRSYKLPVKFAKNEVLL